MAFKKTVVQRLFNLSRFSTPRITRKAPNSDPGSKMRRIQQRRPLYQSAIAESSLRLFPLRGVDIARDRIRLDGLIPFPNDKLGGMTASEVRKVLRASQAEVIRDKLRDINRDWIPYTQFVEICRESCGGNREEAYSFAKTLDESASVIVLGNAVCLRPQQVVKAIQSATSRVDDPRRQELEEMEEHKAEIDRKADGLVRRELWAGLGYLVLQTAAFMRLTFWELSWDVMEPICFYVTSFYFMAGYAFFLTTSKEPSFEGFFQSRFRAKQLKLINSHTFDINRYNQLRKALASSSSSSSSSQPH